MARDQVFISYSHTDEVWKDRVVKHLKVLEHEGVLSIWDDRQIEVGDPWLLKIKVAINSCNVALLLISANFLTSKFILDKEVPALLQRREQEGVRIIPVILKPCAWTRVSWLELIQARPKDGKALSGMSEHDADDALTALTKEVADFLRSLPSVPNIHGWSTAEVQALQKETAQALKVPVKFHDRLKDGSRGPEMAVIPAGEFLMGNRTTGPQHKVVIAKPFAMGCYAVTFEEYDRFCEATQRAKPNDAGWGRDRRPVINMTRHDAIAYCAWLSQETGANYRLPSEAEWEYAARAGTTTAFWWGDNMDTTRANYDGTYLNENSNWIDPTGKHRYRTVPVDTFQPNPFSLHQVHGNVWEWVQDSWHKNYEGAPADGSAWVEVEDSPCVLRGGSWFYEPGWVRGAARLWSGPLYGGDGGGFRLARTFP